jgi:hypothetical protein
MNGLVVDKRVDLLEASGEVGVGGAVGRPPELLFVRQVAAARHARAGEAKWEGKQSGRERTVFPSALSE